MVLFCSLKDEQITLNVHDSIKWITLDQQDINWIPADIQIIEKLKETRNLNMTLTLQPNINLHTLNTVNQTYQPQLLFNDYKQGMKLSYEIIQQLNSCDSFQLSIAFISLSGLATLKQTLLDLQNKNISGKIITSTYLGFNEPKVFKELLKFNNLEIRIYDDPKIGFHQKVIFQKKTHITLSLVALI